MFKRGGLIIIITILLNLSPIAICQEEEKIPWEVIKADTLMTKAQMQDKPELYNKAEDILKEYIKENPYCVWAYMQLAKGYEEQNKIDLAKETYEKTLDLEPQQYFMYTKVIYFYFKHNFLNEAESLAKECIKKFPDEDLRFKEYLVIIYIKKGEWDKAKELIKSDKKLANDSYFQSVAEDLEILPDPKELELINSIRDKIEAIEQKIEGNPQKYSYLHEKIYPYIVLDPFDKDIKELKKINDRLQKIIDEIE